MTEHSRIRKFERLLSGVEIDPKGQHDNLPIQGSFPITDAEYKQVIKSIYPKDNSKKFRR